ncbi:SAM-dependent chlorinase/fluorinase [soil metagenome]
MFPRGGTSHAQMSVWDGGRPDGGRGSGRTLVPMGRPAYSTVSLLTDYGTADEFVGVLKSVIRDLAPHVTTIDITHGIAPFDVRGGSMALARAASYLPEGIVVAVVDPGVGTSRRAVAIEVADGAGVFIGPDNGLLAPAVAVVGGATRAVSLDAVEFQLDAPGATFAGRDIFAPAAAHLSNGVDLADLGAAIDPAVLVPGLVPLPRHEGHRIDADVLWVDRFGNCQLNLGPDELAALLSPEEVMLPGAVLTLIVDDERRTVHTATAFADLGPGSLGLVLDSYGMYALALDQSSAAAELSIGAGDAVTLVTADDAGPGVNAPTGATTPVQLRPPG